MNAWHYTIRQWLPGILADGFLKPATAHVHPPEKPIVWFSLNQTWEPTASKMYLAPNGSMQWGNQETTREHGGGLVRFGLPTEKLLRWTELHRAALIPNRTKNALVRAAKKYGSDPYAWFGSLEPISVDDCIVEIESERAWIASTKTALRELCSV